MVKKGGYTKKASLLFILLLIAGCTTGAWFEDMAPSAVGSDVEDGATDVDPATASFSITFVKAVDVSTVTTSTFFLVEVGAVSSISKGEFNSGVCDLSKAVDGTVSCASNTECTFTPSSQLDSGTQYAICLTNEIEYEDNNIYPGQTITFTTAEAKAEVVPTEYTIGGTITGLSGGDTLVLQNSETDDLTITADGPFTFATAAADLTAYAVTVLTKPAAKTCTVSNGTGTIAGANVTNVTVVCSANAYTVGGTVSGLTGTVVLQNNSSDNLSISANGSFTFATAVADGAGYEVTVKTQPVGQTCTVANGTGTIAGANVTNVNVVCLESGLAQWAKTVEVGSESDFNGVSVDTSGNIYAVGYISGTEVHNFGSGVINGAYAGANAVIVKYDSNGTAQWAKTVEVGSVSDFNGVSVDADGNAYAVGYINADGNYNFGSGVINGGYALGYNVVIVKYNSNGTAQWAKTVTVGGSDSYFNGVSVDADGNNIYAVGRIYRDGEFDFGDGVSATGAGAFSSSVVVVKYDSNGTAQWAKSVTAGGSDSYFRGVSVDTSGNIYAVGYIDGDGEYNFGSGVINGAFAGGSSVVIVKYHPDDGAAQWAKTVVTTGETDSFFNGVSVDADGNNIYAVGRIYGDGTENYDFGDGVISGTFFDCNNVVIVKYNSNGTAQWAKTVTAGENQSEFFGVSVDADGNAYAVGSITGTEVYNFGSGEINGTYVGGYSVVAVKYNSSGTAQWAKTVEAGAGSSYFPGVSVDDTSGNIYAVGYIGGDGEYDFGNGKTATGTYVSRSVVVVKYTK